jgi:hypothetical protein
VPVLPEVGHPGLGQVVLVEGEVLERAEVRAVGE